MITLPDWKAFQSKVNIAWREMAASEDATDLKSVGAGSQPILKYLPCRFTSENDSLCCVHGCILSIRVHTPTRVSKTLLTSRVLPDRPLSKVNDPGTALVKRFFWSRRMARKSEFPAGRLSRFPTSDAKHLIKQASLPHTDSNAMRQKEPSIDPRWKIQEAYPDFST